MIYFFRNSCHWQLSTKYKNNEHLKMIELSICKILSCSVSETFSIPSVSSTVILNETRTEDNSLSLHLSHFKLMDSRLTSVKCKIFKEIFKTFRDPKYTVTDDNQEGKTKKRINFIW